MTLRDCLKTQDFTVGGILHIGACMLEEAEDYRKMGVEKVIWVEAQPHLKERAAIASHFGHMLIEGLPLSDREEEVALRISNNEGGGSSSCLPMKEHARLFPEIVNVGEVKLIARRLDQVLKLAPDIDTLVLDVQGYELRVLNGLGTMIDQIERAFVEVSFVELYEGQPLAPEIMNWFFDRGFESHEHYPHVSGAWGDILFWR